MDSTDANHGLQKSTRPERARASSNLGDEGPEIKINEQLRLATSSTSHHANGPPFSGPFVSSRERISTNCVAESADSLPRIHRDREPCARAGRDGPDVRVLRGDDPPIP